MKTRSLCRMTSKVHRNQKSPSMSECLKVTVHWNSNVHLTKFTDLKTRPIISKKQFCHCWLHVSFSSRSHGCRSSRLKISCAYFINTTRAVTFHPRPRRSEPYAENAKGELKVAMRLALGEKFRGHLFSHWLYNSNFFVFTLLTCGRRDKDELRTVTVLSSGVSKL